jgi:hypothetical protein
MLLQVIAWLLCGWLQCASAQELTPRAYWPAPKGTQLFLAAYAYKTGDIITDASLPIVGVDSRINTAVVAYQRTTGLFGRTSNFRLEVPYTDGVTKGQVAGLPARRDVSGLGDVSLTLAINLVGAPSMNREQFQAFRADPGPIVAASFKLVAPTGEYEDDKLINIGSNRWAGRVELGYIQPLNPKWLAEFSLGTWFFQDNDEFLGTVLRQDNITSFAANVVRRFGPGFWASLDATFYVGGGTHVAGGGRQSFKRNARMGLSLAYPLSPGHALKATWSSGVATESGGDYDTLGLTYVFAFQ